MNRFYSQLFCLCLLSPLLSGCLDKQTIDHIPDAENQLFTADGRLIVTGGEGIYEIVQQDGELRAESLATSVGTCGFTGLAQIRDWVFTACQQRPNGLLGRPDNHLLVAQVIAGQALVFQQVARPDPDPMDQFFIPNGVAASPNGDLLVADYNLFSDAAVAKLQLDFSGPAPKVVAWEKDWLGRAYGIKSPNGVRVSGNELFVSDFNFVKRYVFDSDGNVPITIPGANGEPVKNEVTVYQGGWAGILDDIQPHCGGLLIAHFLGGRLLYAAPDTSHPDTGLPQYRIRYQTWAQSYQQPSSVTIGRPPLFTGHDILTTEKGLLGDLSSDYGNRLTQVEFPEDLLDPLVCEVINEG